MKRNIPEVTAVPRGSSLPVYGKDLEGKKRRGFNCILVNGEPMIESVGRDGRKIKTPVSEAEAAFRQLKLMEESPDWNANAQEHE